MNELRDFADQLRTQLATIQSRVDEIGRDIRIALHHAETVTRQALFLDHARKSLSAALATAFDEMAKLDVLILEAQHAAQIAEAARKAPPPRGNT